MSIMLWRPGTARSGSSRKPTLNRPFDSPTLLSTPGFTGYLAEPDGVPVATGLAAQEGDWVCIFNITTLPEYRQRGYGRAIMDKILVDAYAADTRGALLHSSPLGLNLYRSMGFETAETWTVFFDAGGRRA